MEVIVVGVLLVALVVLGMFEVEGGNDVVGVIEVVKVAGGDE